MATAFLYLRCSHIDSAESGLGLAQQEEQCRAYFDLLRLREPALRDLRLHPHVFRDIAVSAYQKKSAAFDKRPQGRMLLRQVQPGDHIIFARLDRSFRKAAECRRWVDHWLATGVRVHFVDLQVDTSTATGMLLMGLMSYMAEWYSAYISERTKEGFKQKILRAGGVFSNNPAGFKKGQDAEGKPRLERDRPRQVRMRWVRWLLDVVSPQRSAQGLKPFGWWDIAELYDRCQARREGREPYKARSRFSITKKVLQTDYAAAAKIWPGRYPQQRKSG